MEDIIATIPWNCGETYCGTKWHLTHYCIHRDGTYTSCDRDGNHEPVDEEDVPTWQAQQAAWREYYAYCAKHGEDVLREFRLVEYTRKRTARWQVRMSNSIGAETRGLLFCGARRNGRGEWLSGGKLPKPVQEYLGIALSGNQWRMADFKTISELRNVDDGSCTFQKERKHAPCQFWITVDETLELSPDTISRSVKREARKALKNPE